MITRRATLSALAGFAAPRRALASAHGGGASTFPTRAISIVVPYPAGGPVDVMARLIAQSVGNDLGQPITVDNRGGGGGTIGSFAVARAQPDGHTLVLGTNQTHATNQALLPNCPYDAVRDFAGVAGIADIQHMLVVRKDLTARNVSELIGLAKARPGALNVASTGIGSASHLTAELFKLQAGVDLQHIPFRGAAPMATELLVGRIDLTFATLPSLIAYIDAGTSRPLAVASARRAPRLPNIPTLAEAGIPGVEADAWFTLFAPAKTPASVIERLYSAISAGLTKEAAAHAIAAQGMTLSLRPPAELAAWLPDEVTKWAAVIKAAHVTIDR
jgi:tripartite-type tricarboxylate transporter receptor subunit TctC